MKHSFDRRQFLGMSAGALGASLMLKNSSAFAEAASPHFLLQVFLPGGWDTTYLWDARPLEMTKENLLQNVRGTEPNLLKDTRGGSCLVTEAFEPLRQHFDRFSILNGVIMSAGSDGHSENLALFLSGNRPDGDSYLTDSANKLTSRPLSVASYGNTFANLKGDQGLISISFSSLDSLIRAAVGGDLAERKSYLRDHIFSRYNAFGRGSGIFAAGNRALARANRETATLNAALRVVPPPPPEAERPDLTSPKFGEAATRLFAGLFRSKVTCVGQIVLDGFQLDTHAFSQVAQQADIYKTIGEQLAAVFATLSSEKFDETRSMLDVTTVVVGSEFTRTMKQKGAKVDATGTDHNPLTNSVLLGGKGIKGGLVLGASDFSTPGETLSGAHLRFDPDRIRLMGRPFDIESLSVSNESLSAFDSNRYLSIGNVINTVKNLIGVPENQWHMIPANSTVASTKPFLPLKNLLS